VISAERIARIVGGTLLRGDGATPSRAIHDSRLVHPGDLFVALPGRRADGHDHLEEAFARGACAAFVSRSKPIPSGSRNLIVVPDTLSALQTWAAAWRGESGATLVGITGTNGKTTVKQLLGHLLAADATCYVAPHNYNTEIGLPLSLLEMPAGSAFGVFELGADRPGDIAALMRILRPTWGLITSIGPGHLEGLGSLEAVAEEKSALLDGLPSDGVAVLPAESTLLMRRAATARCNVLTVGRTRGDVRGRVLHATPRLEIELEEPQITLCCPLVGAHHATNVLLACAAAHAMGTPWEVIRERTGTFPLPPHRLERIATPTATLLDDTYNANPASAEGALRVLAEIEPAAPLRVFVFGEMRGLGTETSRYHREILDLALSLPIDLILPVGEAAVDACRDVVSPAVVLMPDRARLLQRLRSLPKNAVVLIKGSRALGLEALVDDLTASS